MTFGKEMRPWKIFALLVVALLIALGSVAMIGNPRPSSANLDDLCDSIRQLNHGKRVLVSEITVRRAMPSTFSKLRWQAERLFSGSGAGRATVGLGSLEYTFHDGTDEIVVTVEHRNYGVQRVEIVGSARQYADLVAIRDGLEAKYEAINVDIASRP